MNASSTLLHFLMEQMPRSQKAARQKYLLSRITCGEAHSTTQKELTEMLRHENGTTVHPFVNNDSYSIMTHGGEPLFMRVRQNSIRGSSLQIKDTRGEGASRSLEIQLKLQENNPPEKIAAFVERLGKLGDSCVKFQIEAYGTIRFILANQSGTKKIEIVTYVATMHAEGRQICAGKIEAYGFTDDAEAFEAIGAYEKKLGWMPYRTRRDTSQLLTLADAGASA